MSDNKHKIPVRAIEPSGNRRLDSALDPAHWTQVAANADSQLVREYEEAFLLIYKVHGQMKGPAVDGNLIESMVADEVEERQRPSRRIAPHMIEGQLVPSPADRPSAGPKLPGMTFTELARRFSKQMDEVVATGKQINAASRQMTSGIKDLNDGVGMLKRKLSRVKY